MNFKEKLKEIKNILFNDETQEQEITFMDIRALDGRVFRVNELIEGEKIQEIDEDGLLDIHPGEYQIEGGLVVIVGEGSIIGEVKQVEVAEVEFSTEETAETEVETTAETENEEAPEFTDETEETVETEVVEEVVEEVNFNSEIIQILEKLTADFNEYKEKSEKELELIKEDFSKFKKEPSAEPTNTKKIEFSKEMDKFEKLKYFSKRK